MRNFSQEMHVFHLHQTEFLIKRFSGTPEQTLGGGLRDVINIPYAAGGKPGFAEIIIPFTNPIIAGEFVYHCHLVQHEDAGMMANIKVLPRQTTAELIWDKVTKLAGLDLPSLWSTVLPRPASRPNSRATSAGRIRPSPRWPCSRDTLAGRRWRPISWRMGVQIVWFKRDLRVADHGPLAEAAALGPVLPLVVIEPDLWRQPDMSGRQFAFVAECLAELRERLASASRWWCGTGRSRRCSRTFASRCRWLPSGRTRRPATPGRSGATGGCAPGRRNMASPGTSVARPAWSAASRAGTAGRTTGTGGCGHHVSGLPHG